MNTDKTMESCVRFLGETYAIKDGHIRRIVGNEFFDRVNDAQLLYDLLMRAHKLELQPLVSSSNTGKWWSVKFKNFPWVQEKDLLAAVIEAVALWDYKPA